MSVLGRAFAWPVRLYRRYLSPLKPPMCRFAPTCSQYAIEALETHGLFKGSALALWRIARCQPFCEGGHDPVPPRRERRRV
ncbi:MAG: membrane protein insertion efficiency factor YidD [Planctomycetes bacterium]|nr:membrane protein insertion efficiency factor YidD [Planctomycetota bacterium]